MGRTARISEAEWEVMQVIWNHAPITANDITDRLDRDHDWDFRTIKTMLNRLVKKGALKYEPRGRSYLYRPAVLQEACVREEGARFLDRVFRGSSTPLIAHFIESADLTEDDLNELSELLARKKS